MSFIQKFDFVTLVETFVESFTSTQFPDFTSFVAPAKKLSKKGRRSGGIIILIKNKVLPYFKRVDVDNDNVIIFEADRVLFGTDLNVFLVSTYLPPINSPFYDTSDFDNGVSMLDQCLLDILEKKDDAAFIMCGDFNARTGSKVAPFYDLESDCGVNVDGDLWSTSSFEGCHYSQRSSQDPDVNPFGRRLLDLCSSLDMHILNGACDGDRNGRLTYITSNGSSVIDYFIVSCSLASLVDKMCVLDRIDSKHMPVSCTIKHALQQDTRQNIDSCSFVYKMKWSEEKQASFMNKLNQPESLAGIEKASNLIDVSIDEAVSTFTSVLNSVAECLVVRHNPQKSNSTGSAWFDKECEDKRRDTRRSLRQSRSTLCPSDRESYCETRKVYKKLLDEKEKQYKQKCREELESCFNDSQNFWKNVKRFSRKSALRSDITNDQWLEHFKNVFNANNVAHVNESEEPTCHSESHEGKTSPENETLNSGITLQEVKAAIDHLKANKAAGPDGVIPEVFKCAHAHIIPFLVQLFNAIFSSGVYPEAWTEAIIHPLHKKGDVHTPDNYRGISLLNICGKLYSFIINKRLSSWVEEQNLLGDIQAGFRKDHRTVDHIFTLFSMIQRHLLRKKKLYVAFIDFRKAFDLISHCKLWPILRGSGVEGKMLQAIQGMYRRVKGRVRYGCKLTDAFFCHKGLKQGEITSPLLFSLFINDLASEIICKGKHGIQMVPDLLELFILLFADDIVLLSDTVVGLQNQLNILAHKANDMDLEVNLEKSNIIIFRNGGYISQNEKWFFNGVKMKIVSSYKYLGLVFTTRMTFSNALNDMASRAKKGVFELLRTLWRLGDFSPNLFLKLFDAQIQPILLYGSEIWGLYPQTQIEKIHTFALKKILNVAPRTPNDIAYAETGRYPLYIFSHVACIKYWLRLVKMNDSRLPKKAYNMQLYLHRQGKFCWTSQVRLTLYKFGFGFVWENQGVQCEKAFLKRFRQRLIDCNIQNWQERINTSARFEVYRVFKLSVCMETYFTFVKNKHIRDVLIRFRAGVSELRSHKLRYSPHTLQDLFCPFCKKAPEDEMHILFHCDALNDLRCQYLPFKYTSYPCLVSFQLIMQNKKGLHDLGRFIYYVNKRRDLLPKV